MLGLEGRIWKEENFWLVEVPLLDVMTLGKTKKEALIMIKNAIESLVNEKGFTIEVCEKKGSIEVYSSRPSALVAMMLKRLREANGLSLAEVAKQLNQKSKNAYARYEQGKAIPTIDKLAELLKAVDSKPIMLTQKS